MKKKLNEFEIYINLTVRINYLVDKFPFVLLNGNQHERSIKLFNCLRNSKQVGSVKRYGE
jgi:hypothetical protein